MTTALEFQTTVRRQVADWVPRVVRAAAIELQGSGLRNAVAADRLHTSEALALLKSRADDYAAALSRALLHQLDRPRPSSAESAAAADAQPTLALSLIAEEQIDESIEVARIVRLIEATTEDDMHLLARLCSSLLDSEGVDTEAIPLHPGLCARALSRSLEEFSLSRPARLLMVRHVGEALAQELRQVYAGQNKLLAHWGVQPLEFRIRQLPGGADRHADAAPDADADPSDSRPAGLRPASPATLPAPLYPSGPTEFGAMGPLTRLVEWARESLEDAAAASPALRLLAEPAAPHAPGDMRGLGPAAAIRVMGQLFDLILQQAAISPGARELVRKLHGPACQIAAREPDLWTSLDHPWWQLLDRILTLGTVQDATEVEGPGGITTSLGLVVDKLRQAGPLNRQACLTAVAAVDQVAAQLLDERHGRLGSTAHAAQPLADREQLEAELRNQIISQLHDTPVHADLRRFLVGPWAMAMSAVALRYGMQSRQLGEQALLVDELLQAGGSESPLLMPVQVQALIERVQDGLAPAGLSAARMDAELADLSAALSNPPPRRPRPSRRDEQAPPPPAVEVVLMDVVPVEEVAPVLVEEVVVEPPVEEALAEAAVVEEAVAMQAAREEEAPKAAPKEARKGPQGYDALPTVPIDMVETGETTPATLDCRAWIDTLEPGTYCRMFLLGAWITAQLTWVSRNRNLFVFSSRHAGRLHSMTRRALEKARGAGLAATITQGVLLAQAMDRLTDAGPL
jgi:hypothetical protein